MAELHVGFWIPAYLVIGVLAHGLDARFGVPSRRFLVNLVSREPNETDQGFIVGTSHRAMLVWSLFISYALSAVVIATTEVAWYLEAALAVPEAFACFVGMNAAPAVARLCGRVDAIRQAAPSYRSAVAQALEQGKRASREMRERLRTADADSERIRRSKIEAMDNMLGKRERPDARV